MTESNSFGSDPVLLVLTNFPDLDTARQIGTALVEKQLAACVNLLPPATSIYSWKGKLETETEIPAFLKTTREVYPLLERELTTLHPYDEPEIIALELTDGSPSYLDWVREQTVTPPG